MDLGWTTGFPNPELGTPQPKLTSLTYFRILDTTYYEHASLLS